MATKEQLNSVTENLNHIPGIIQTCHDIVFALIENNEEIFSGSIWGLFSPNEYDRAREEVISKCLSVIRELKSVRRSILSPDAIRATSYLNNVERYCRVCPAKNKSRMSEGRPFCCFVMEMNEKKSPSNFHFRLNSKGEIVGQS